MSSTLVPCRWYERCHSYSSSLLSRKGHTRLSSSITVSPACSRTTCRCHLAARRQLGDKRWFRARRQPSPARHRHWAPWLPSSRNTRSKVSYHRWWLRGIQLRQDSQLDNRDRYPGFRIPIVGLPATILQQCPHERVSRSAPTPRSMRWSTRVTPSSSRHPHRETVSLWSRLREASVVTLP